MSYLVDTNVVSELSKTELNPGVDEWLSRVHLDDVFLSVITLGEMRRGIARLHRRNDHRQAMRLEKWLATTRSQFVDRLVPVTTEVAEEWGNMDISRPTPTADGLIAATAKVHGWTLVTRNVKDFEHVGVRVLNPFTD